MISRFHLFSRVVVAWAALMLAGLATAANPVETTLANGLRVIVHEDHRAPTVVAMVWYRAGSIDEVNGTTGVAHVLEHMMFKGTKIVPPGEYSRIIAAAGGRDNAMTSRDFTAYHVQLHKSQLELALKLEADRMVNLQLTDEEFAKEIKVVMEERRLRTEDRASGLLFEQLMASSLTANPYRTPVIGWMDDLINMRPQDARDWYNNWYAPNNAVLVVVGDVAAQEVFALAQKYFGPLAMKTLPVRKPQTEPAQTGQRRVTVKAPAELPSVLMVWPVPVIRDPATDREPYALEVLGGILDGNGAARLPSKLVREEKMATSVGASYDSTIRGPGQFYLSGTPVAGRSVAEIEQALKRELQRVADEGVTAEELNRVKAQVMAAQVFQRDSMFYQGMQIGMLEMAGISHTSVDLQLERLRAVTAAEVQAVARKYFIDDRLTVATLDPQPLSGSKPAAPSAGVRHAQ
ncbi:MAG: M16 family metallopeptidase [Burkholderiales bacterium]